MRLTASSHGYATDTLTWTFDFTVTLIDNPCQSGISGLAGVNTTNLNYVAHTTPNLFIDFAGVNNGECDFDY